MDALDLCREDQVDAYMHPERMRILRMITAASRTISQVASEMGVHPANITHHFRRLQAAKLIELEREVNTGRNVEKYYLAAARCFHVRATDGEVENANAKVLTFLRDDIDVALTHLKGDDSEPVLGLILNVGLAPRDFRAFATRLQALAKEYAARGTEGAPAYSLNLSLYPNPRDYGPTGRIDIRKKKKTATRKKTATTAPKPRRKSKP